MATITDSDMKRYDRFRDSYAKEITERQKVLTSLATMASALIALPLLFFKDIFRETIKTGDTLIGLITKQYWVVSGIAYLSWTTLIFCIFFCLIYTMKAGEFLHNLYKYDYPPDYLDGDGGANVHKLLNRIFDLAVYTFMSGFWLMIAFILLYAKTSPDLVVK